jgi:ABC-type transport system involved in cytochrome c biogenesis ATPase subunit
MFNKDGSKGNYGHLSLDEYSDDDSDGGNGGNGGDDFATNSIQRQQQQMRQQDEGLEMLGQSADRLGQMSMTISEELGFQNKMLDEMDQDLDEANENLDFVTRKTKEMIEKSGGTKNCLVIAALAGVVVLLFFLILYS